MGRYSFKAVMLVSLVLALFSGFSAASAASCGLGGMHRVVGGVTSIPNNWPWQVSLQAKAYSWDDDVETVFEHSCGGSIINENWILSAGHCFQFANKEPEQWEVVAGEHDLNKDSGIEQVRKVTKIIKHPGYTWGPAPNDIALMKLDKPLRFGKGVYPVCLPEQDDVTDINQKNCMLTGWGLTKGKQDRTKLQQVGGPIVEPASCRAAWKPTNILDTTICFGTGLKGGCMGDSGGPLVCREGRRWYQVGVVSWGNRQCKIEGYPTIFTRTSKFADWINETINKN